MRRHCRQGVVKMESCGRIADRRHKSGQQHEALQAGMVWMQDEERIEC